MRTSTQALTHAYAHKGKIRKGALKRKQPEIGSIIMLIGYTLYVVNYLLIAFMHVSFVNTDYQAITHDAH